MSSLDAHRGIVVFRRGGGVCASALTVDGSFGMNIDVEGRPDTGEQDGPVATVFLDYDEIQELIAELQAEASKCPAHLRVKIR